MKLITEHGQLPLPDDLEISVEQHNPFFSDEGASSIPVTIPATQQALSVLGRPERVGSTSRLRRMAATLSEGAFIRNGQLLMESASADEGITCSFLMAESEFYTKFKEKNLRDIFKDKVRQEWLDMAALYSYLTELYHGDKDDDFILCPVAVDYDSEASTYRVNNAPLDGGSWNICPGISRTGMTRYWCRTVTASRHFCICTALSTCCSQSPAIP